MKKRRRKQARRPLTDQQKQAAQLMFDAHPIGEIASILGVHRSTIWRWRNRKDFQRELRTISDKWLRETRRKYRMERQNSPEYKRQQRRKYEARRKLKKLEERISEAGNSGNMKAYRAACNAYNKCFNEAYLNGMTIDEFEQKITGISYHQKRTRKPAEKPVKYIIEFV